MSIMFVVVVLCNEIVFVVDDDEVMCDLLMWLFEGNGYIVCIYCSVEEFLVDDKCGEGVGCLIFDVCM